jgi:hypothetical protein
VHRAPEPIVEKLANAEGGASHRLAVRLDRSTVWLHYLETNNKNLYKKGSILLFCKLSFCIRARIVITIQKIYYFQSAVLDCGTMVSKVKEAFQNHHENHKKIILFAKNKAIYEHKLCTLTQLRYLVKQVDGI